MKSTRSALEDAQHRVEAATREFRALLQRHRVEYLVEQGTNSVTGAFTRIAFYVGQPPPKDPAA